MGDEISNPGLNCTIISLHHLYILLIDLYFSCILVCRRIQFYLCACIIYLFIYLIDVYI